MMSHKRDLFLFFAFLALFCSPGACGKDEQAQPGEAAPGKAAPGKAEPGKQPAPRPPGKSAKRGPAGEQARAQTASPQPGPAGPEAPGEPAAPQDAGPDASMPTEPPSEEEARQLLEAWLLAQNRGKFGEYVELHAGKMAGVKHSGPDIRLYPRERWLKDRKRSFRRRRQVTADAVRIRIAGNAAVIWFDQGSSSRSREDRGPRRLVAVREAGALRIANHAVLRADAKPRKDERPVDPQRLMFALHADRTYLVLSNRAGESEAAGEPRLLAGETVFAAGKRVEAAAVPASLRPLLGKTVQLYTEGGVACRGKLDKPRLIRRVIPHHSMRAHWGGEPAVGRPGERLSADRIARDVWELGWGETLLVSEVSGGRRGSCRKALWGRVVGEKNPEIFLGTVASERLSKKIGDKVRRLRGYRSLQQALRSAGRGQGAAKGQGKGGLQPDMRVWRAGRRELRSFAATAGIACDGSGRSLWVLYEMLGNTWLMLTEDRRPADVRPLAVMEVDGDSRLEVLAAPQLYEAGEAARLWRQRVDLVFEQVDSIEAAYLDSGC
jgi:hypothetical protein